MSMNISPLISVVVIGYNIEKYVGNCIESILKQKYCNFELIFVDDGSKDNTLSIVKQYEADPRVKIVEKKNGGIVSARKAGVRAATGDYLIFVDGDDWLNDDMLQNFSEDLGSATQDVDIVCSSMNRQEADGKFYTQISCEYMGIYSGDAYFEYIMQDKANHHMFPKLYSFQFVLKAGYLDYPEVTMAEDLMTNCFFGIHRPSVLFVDQVNYYYRFNESSVMRSGNNTLLRQIGTLNCMEEYVGDNCKIIHKNELLEYQWISYVYTYMHSPLSHKMKKEIMHNCREKICGYKKNVYCKELFAKYPWHVNILFNVYYKLPLLAGIIDNGLSWLKQLKNRGQR